MKNLIPKKPKIGFIMKDSPLSFAPFVRGVDNRKGEEKIVPNIGNSKRNK